MGARPHSWTGYQQKRWRDSSRYVGSAGEFQIAVDFRSLFCLKSGGLFTAFTEEQLTVQRAVCENVYGAFFGVQGESPDSTRTFCSTAT